MKKENYLQLFHEITQGRVSSAPYNDEHYLHYTKMNLARQERWLKKGTLTPATIEAMTHIELPMQWIVISEPWCGDAAHILPFLFKMSALNPTIDLNIQLRDSEASEIDQYLTNGGKAIPVLIVRNEQGKDLFHWGPRPNPCQKMVDEKKQEGASQEELINAIQQWYNHDQGVAIQKEVTSLLETSI
jgi:hypothetical protein